MAELPPKLPPADDALSGSTVYDDIMSSGAGAAESRNRYRDPYYDDLVGYAWWSIARGITLGGTAYPSVIAAVYIVVGVVATTVTELTSTQPLFDKSVLATLVIGALLFAVIAGGLGFLWSAIVTVVTLPLAHVVVWSMRLRPNLVWLGAFTGGLVGFVAVLPAAMQIPGVLGTGQAWGATALVLMGPALATVVGQIGGALGGRRAIEQIAASRMPSKIQLLRMKFAMRLPDRKEAVDDVALDSGADDDSPRFRFRTIHLLWVGVWFSVLLTTIRLSGIPYELILPLLLGWAGFQALTLHTGKLLIRRFGPWWNRE